jgi:hypothetical protein
MKTLLASLVVLLAALTAAVAGDETVPGRDENYEFAGPRDLAGTVWKGDMTPNGFLVVRFERDGTVCYTYTGGTWRNGHWKQDGDRLHMVIGSAHVKFDAVIRGDRMAGGGINDAQDRRRLDLMYVGPIGNEEPETRDILEPRK